MGSMTDARPAARPGRGAAMSAPRPALVTALAAVWILLSIGGAVGAILALARGANGAEERALAVLALLLSALLGAGAIGLLRRMNWARAVLATAGVLVLLLSAFGTWRRVSAAAAPAAELAATEPDAANALALFRAGSAVAFLVGALPLVVALGLLRHPTVRDWANPEAAAARSRNGPDTLLVVVGGALAVAALSFFLSKKSSSPGAQAKPATIVLAPAETFLWSDQPVTFAVPREPFTRERHAEGGRKGVSFTRYAVPPTRITVAEAFLDPAPNGPDEALAKLRLTTESFRSADSAEVGDPAPATVGGAPGFRTDYAIRERAMDHVGRELVAVAGRHVFVFTFLGRPSDLAVFDALLASAAFPPPGGPEGTIRTVPGGDSPAAGAGTSEIRVGEHRVLVSVPAGFERVDYGSKQEFRSDETRIALVDGGELPPGTGAANLEDDWLVQRALKLFEHDARRWEVGAKTRITVGDRDALVVDTREPLSHAFHKRTVVFVNGGRLLAGGMVMGLPETSRAALDALARSVRFPL
jgi:hypothetical protein